MPTSLADPRVTFRTLLSGSWDDSNTSSTTPDFSTGWLNVEGSTRQVTITAPQEVAEGASGWAAQDGGGAGPISVRVGSLFVDCWAKRVKGGTNPKQLVYDFGREVERIVAANVLGVTGMDYVSVRSSQAVPPDLERSREWHHWSVEIGYQWRRTPA